jgi:RNA polymerase sigma factor (sigma-70 family)
VPHRPRPGNNYRVFQELLVPRDREVPNQELDRAVDVLRVALLADRAGPSDTELLDRFRQHGDESAFAALVRRHGAKVLSACRRVLTDPADIDDAFQATFLVLFRKIRNAHGPTIGSWLHAVAHRIAVRARSDSRRRAEREKRAAGRSEQAAVLCHDLAWRETVAILHEVLDQMPDAYRRVLLLCYLSGQSRDEAATNLGLSVGAVKGRLERGRQILERRLARRGIGLSVGLLALGAGNSSQAAVPSWDLVFQTARAVGGTTKPAVLALTVGAYPMATLAWKFVAGVVVTGGIVVLASQGSQPDKAQSGKSPEKVTPINVQSGKKDAEPVFKEREFKERADKAVGPVKSPEQLADEAAPKRPQTDVGKLLNRWEKLKFGTDDWARALRDLIQLGPNAVPELIAELDSTRDEYMLRCLAFVLRGIGDKRAIPALIRAFPKVAVPSHNDYGCTAQDRELMAFMLRHDCAGGKSTKTFSFGRPINEFRAALQELTGVKHGEDELVYVSVALDSPAQRRHLQRALFHQCAERWAKWWQLHWKEYVSDAYYSRVKLPPFSGDEESNQAVRSPEGQKAKIYGRAGQYVLEAARKPYVLESVLEHHPVFFDLDSGRIGNLPEFLSSAEHEPERTDDILAWAATEGFDLMCTEYKVPGQVKPQYVLRGLGLAAWQIDEEQQKTLEADISMGKRLRVGRRTDGILAPFDVAKGRFVADLPAMFLFRTREGTYGTIDVDVQGSGDRSGRRFDFSLVAGEVDFAESAGR